MISKATIKYLRISPRKVRLVIALIKGKSAIEALSILKATNKKAAFLLSKVLNSVIANAKRLPNIDEKYLYISKISADGGPSLKRYKAQALGRATMILKRTSHIRIELDANIPKVKPKESKPAAKTTKAVKGTNAEKMKTVKPKEKKQKTVKEATKIAKKSVKKE